MQNAAASIDFLSLVFLQAAELVEKIRLLGGLVIKDRSYHFKSYKTCFVGELLLEPHRDN